MNKIQYTFLLVAACFISVNCSGIKGTSSSSQPEEFIILEVNEATKYTFQRFDTTWTGSKTTYTLSSSDEKEVHNNYIVIEDRSWQDFGDFINYLKLYTLPPQHEIEGWVPDSGTLPKKVYRFEVFNGDSPRSFSYQDPEREMYEYWELTHVVLFTTLVEQELNWREQQ